MKCLNCGNDVEPGQEFCKNCGTKCGTENSFNQQSKPEDHWQQGSYRNPTYANVQARPNNTVLVVVIGVIITLLVCALIAMFAMNYMKLKDEKVESNKEPSIIVINPDGTKTINTQIKPSATQQLSSDKVFFVKGVANAGIYIRSEPAKLGKENVILHIMEDDYSTRLQYTNNYTEQYDSSDGMTYTWYEVIVPNGNIGWVRSDVVTVAD